MYLQSVGPTVAALVNRDGISEELIVLVTEELLATEDERSVRLSWGKVDVYTDSIIAIRIVIVVLIVVFVVPIWNVIYYLYETNCRGAICSLNGLQYKE